MTNIDSMFLPDEVNEVMNKSLPEAPMSTHIDAYYKGFHVGFTHRSDKNETPVANTVALIGRLIAAGYEPSWNKETTNGHLKAETTATTPQAAPQNKFVDQVANLPLEVDLSVVAHCPVHGTQLQFKQGISKKNNKPYAFWSCPTKNADGSYCQAGNK